MKPMPIAVLLGLSLTSAAAHAALTCSIAAPAPVAFAYVANTGTASATNVQQGTISITCTRTANGDATTVSLAANDGLHVTSKQSHVQLSAGGSNFRVSYKLFKDSSCSAPWEDKPNDRLSATLPAALNIPVTVNLAYWACKTTAQALTSYPTGIYTDRVDLSLFGTANNTVVASTSLNISLYAPALCSLSNGPTNLHFTYAAFAPAAVFAGTSFKANCTNLLPYTMSLSPSSGVVSGLRYSLGLSLSQAGTAANLGSVSLQAQGNATGAATHFINGAMPAGQPGQNGVMVPQIHTLTVSY